MSEIKNGGLDQYGAEPFERQQFGTAGVERVKSKIILLQTLLGLRLLRLPVFSIIWYSFAIRLQCP